MCYFLTIGAVADPLRIATFFEEQLDVDVAVAQTTLLAAFPTEDVVLLLTRGGCSCDLLELRASASAPALAEAVWLTPTCRRVLAIAAAELGGLRVYLKVSKSMAARRAPPRHDARRATRMARPRPDRRPRGRRARHSDRRAQLDRRNRAGSTHRGSASSPLAQPRPLFALQRVARFDAWFKFIQRGLRGSEPLMGGGAAPSQWARPLLGQDHARRDMPDIKAQLSDAQRRTGMVRSDD